MLIQAFLVIQNFNNTETKWGEKKKKKEAAKLYMEEKPFKTANWPFWLYTIGIQKAQIIKYSQSKAQKSFIFPKASFTTDSQ